MQWATAMPLEAAPGSRFRYANNDALLAARSVLATLGDGQAAIDFPFTELIWRIGKFPTAPETDWHSKKVVIVRRGFDPANGGIFDIARYGRDILASLDSDFSRPGAMEQGSAAKATP
jgi:hypothetical protein